MPLRNLREIPRKELNREGRNNLYVVLGSLVLAFASACFLEPLEIVSGGLLSIGIILNGVIEPLAGFNVSDIVVAIASILFWLIGLIFIGWKFSARTLLSSLLYPAFFSLFLRTGFIDVVGLSALVGAGEGEEVRHLIGGLFGGFLTGAGVAISFLGDGSTGGVDIIALLLGKATPIREDIWTFAIDASLVLIGASSSSTSAGTRRSSSRSSAISARKFSAGPRRSWSMARPSSTPGAAIPGLGATFSVSSSTGASSTPSATRSPTSTRRPSSP